MADEDDVSISDGVAMSAPVLEPAAPVLEPAAPDLVAPVADTAPDTAPVITGGWAPVTREDRGDNTAGTAVNEGETSTVPETMPVVPDLMIGSAFGMKVPPPEYSGIPQVTEDRDPELAEVLKKKKEFGQGDEMSDIRESVVGDDLAPPLLEPAPTKKSKKKKKRSQKDDMDIMPSIAAPAAITVNPPSRITGPIELDEEDYKKDDSEPLKFPKYPGPRPGDDEGPTDRDRARSSERRGGRRGDRDRRDDRRGRNDDEDEYGRSGRNWSQRPRHGKYKYPDDFDEEDFEDFGEEDYGNDYDEYGPPHGRHGRDYGPGPGHYGPGPDFHGPHGPGGYGPRHFGPDGYGGYGPPPLLGPPNMGPMGPGPPMGPGGPMGPGYPGGYGPPGYMDGYQGPPGPGYPMPPQGPWQGDGGFPPQPNYPMPPQPPAGFSGEVFQGFPNIPVPAMPPTDAAPPMVQPSESAEKLIAMGMNPDLAKILDADSKNKPRLDSDPGTPSKSKKKKKKKDKAGPELPADMMQLPMSIPLPDDVPLPPEPKKKKSKKREKDLENVMFPPLPEALTTVLGPAPKPATPPVPPTDGTTETFTGVQPPVQPTMDISQTGEVSSMPGINVNPLQYSASVPQPVQAPQTVQAPHVVQDPQVYVPPPAVVENITLSQPITQVSAGPEQVPQVVPQPVQAVKPSGRRSRFDPNWTPEQKQAPVAVPPPVPEVVTQVPPPQMVSDVIMSVPPVPESAPQPPVPEVTPQPPVPVEPLPVQPVPAPIPQQHIPLQTSYLVPPVTKPTGQNFAETATHTQKIEDFSPMDISMEQSPPRGEGKPDDKPADPVVGHVYFENKVYGKDDASSDSQASKEPVTASQLLEKFKQKRQQQNTDPKSDFTVGNVEQKTPVDKSQGKFTFAIRKLKQLEAEKEEEEKQVLEALAAGDDQKQSAKDSKDNKGKDKVSVEADVTGSKDKKDRSSSRSRDRRSRSRSGSRSKHRRYRSDSRDRSNSRDRYKSRARSKSRSKSRDRKRRSRSKKRDRSLSPWRKDREFFRRYGRFPRPGEADTITRETASSSKERGGGRYDNRFDNNNRSRGSRGGNRYGDYGRNWDHGRSWGRDRSRDDDRDRERSRDDRDSRDRKRDKGRYSKYSDEEEFSKKSKDKKKRRGHSSSSERDSSSHSESSDDGKRKKKKNKKKSKDRSSSGERSKEKSKDRSESADKKGRKSRDRKYTDEGTVAVVKQEPVDDDNMTGEDKLAEKSNDEMTSSITQEQMVSTFVPVDTGDSIYTAEEMDTDSPEKNPETSEKNQTDYDEGEIVDERESDNDAIERTNRSRDRTDHSQERKDRSRERTDHSRERTDRSRERTDHSRDKKAERERREYSRERSESFSKQKDKARASSEEVEEKRSHKSRDKSDKYGSKYSKEDSYEEEEDRHRSSREDKYSRHREDKHKRRDRNDDQGERERSRKYRDYDDDDDGSYKRRGRDDDRQKRHDDRYSRSEGAEETVHTKSKWDSGSESETERTHIEELPVRGSSSIPEPCIEDLQPVPGKSGVVKLEIDISKINQKLLSKMMKSKNTTKSGSEQTSDSSDDNESKYKRKQKKDKEKETKKSKKGKKKEESESESEDSPVKSRKKKKTKKKKKHYDDEESDDDEVVSKKKKKDKYATSESEASSGEDVRSKKKYTDKNKSRKHDSDSEGSTSKYRKDKQKKTKKVKKYESSDEEYVVKKHKKSRYDEDSEDNGRKKNESAKKKKGKDKSKSYDESDAESPDRKSKHKSKHSRDRSESIGDREKGRSKKSKDKYDDNETKKSRKKNKGRDESENSDSQAESKPKSRKDRNASESDDGSRKKHSSKYDSDESDGYTAKPKNSKQHKETDHDDSENERSKKKRRKKDEDRKSKSVEREDKPEKKYKDHVDDSDNEDRNSRKKSSRHSSEKSAKDSRHYSKERLMAEEKRSESREKRYNESTRSDKVKKRSRSRSADERSYKVLKSDKKKHRHSSESESNSDRDVKQKSRRRGSSSEDGRKGKSSRKYEDERPKKSERSRREEKSGRDRHSDSSPDVETKHKYKKDESADEDYRSRKKREVDKKGRKKKYSSSVSENSSSSSSDTGSDSDREQRRTKLTGQKNVLAATGLETGPVAGTPPMTENRDDEMSERNVLPDDYNEKYPILSENEELEAQLVKDKLDTSTEKTEKNSKKKDKKKNKKKKKKKKSELKNRKSKELELNKSSELDNAEQHSDKQDDVDSISNNNMKSKTSLPVVEYGSSSSEMETNTVSAKLEKHRGSVESDNSKGRINFRLSSTDEKTDIKNKHVNKDKYDVGRKESKRMSISPEFRRNDKQQSFSPENRRNNKQRSFSPENRRNNKQRSFSPENRRNNKQRSFSPENKKKDKQRSTSPEIKATEKRRSSSPKEIKNKFEDKQLTENSEELYDPFEGMDEDSDVSEMELEKHESSKQSVDIKANDELKPATQTALTLSSRTILPDITQGVIPSPTVYPIQLSVGPVAPPSGVLAPLIVSPLSQIVPNQTPLNINPVQPASPQVSLDAIRQPVVPVVTAPVPAVQPVPEPLVSVTTPAGSNRLDPGKLTSSKQKAVVQVYIPSGDKGERKNKSRSRWGAAEDASKPKQEVDSAELYDPFSDMLTYSPNPESEPIAAEPVKNATETVQIASKPIKDSSPVPVSLPADTDNCGTKSEGQKSDNLNKITMKFVTGRKLIGKSAIEMEESEEKLESAPKMKLSTPSLIGLESPPKIKSTPGLSAIQISQQVAASIEKTLDAESDRRHERSKEIKDRSRDRSRERTERERSRERSDRDRSRERTDRERSRERTDRDRSRERTDRDRSRESPPGNVRSRSPERVYSFTDHRRRSLSPTRRERKRSPGKTDRSSYDRKPPHRRSESRERRSKSRDRDRHRDNKGHPGDRRQRGNRDNRGDKDSAGRSDRKQSPVDSRRRNRRKRRSRNESPQTKKSQRHKTDKQRNASNSDDSDDSSESSPGSSSDSESGDKGAVAKSKTIETDYKMDYGRKSDTLRSDSVDGGTTTVVTEMSSAPNVEHTDIFPEDKEKHEDSVKLELYSPHDSPVNLFDIPSSDSPLPNTDSLKTNITVTQSGFIDADDDKAAKNRSRSVETDEPVIPSGGRLTRKQAAVENVVLPPVMSKTMLVRSGRRRSSAETTNTELQHEGKGIQDVELTGENIDSSKNQTDDAYDPEDETVTDTPMTGSNSMDENDNTVSVKASNENDETPEQCMDIVDMDLDDSDDTEQNIELGNTDKHTDKLVEKTETNTTLPKISIETLSPSEMPVRVDPGKPLGSESAASSVKGFSLKLGTSVFKKQKPTLTTSALQSVFDTDDSKPDRPKINFKPISEHIKPKSEPLKPLTFGSIELKPPAVELTAAVASFKPLSEGSSAQPDMSMKQPDKPDTKAEERRADAAVHAGQRGDGPAVPSSVDTEAVDNTAPVQNVREPIHTSTAVSTVRADNMVRIAQISPEQIGKAIQVIGQENLRRLEVMKREVAQRETGTIEGQKIEVVGSATQLTTQLTTPLTACTSSLQGTSSLAPISNLDIKKEYEDPDLNQLEREKQELLDKLDGQDDATPTYDDNYSPRCRSPPRRDSPGRHDSPRRRNSPSRRDSPARRASPARRNSPPRHDSPARRDSRTDSRDSTRYDSYRGEDDRYGGRVDRRGEEYDDRKSSRYRENRDRRHSRDRSPERSRDRGRYRGRDGRDRDRGRTPDRSRDRSRERRNRKRSYKDEDRFRQRRRSRSRSRDRRSYSRDRRSRSRERRERRSSSRGRDKKRSRSRDRRSWSRDKRSWSKDRRRGRHSRSRSREKRSRSRDKSDTHRKESALEKFEKELAEKKKTLLHPVSTSGSPSVVSQPGQLSTGPPHATSVDGSLAYTDPALAQYGPLDPANTAPPAHFLPQPFPVHHNMPPMFPMGPAMSDQGMGAYPPDPNLFPSHHIGQPFYGDGMQPPPPQMGPIPPDGMQPPHMMPPGGPMGPPFTGPPGFMPGMFPPGPPGPPHPMDPNFQLPGPASIPPDQPAKTGPGQSGPTLTGSNVHPTPPRSETGQLKDNAQKSETSERTSHVLTSEQTVDSPNLQKGVAGPGMPGHPFVKPPRKERVSRWSKEPAIKLETLTSLADIDTNFEFKPAEPKREETKSGESGESSGDTTGFGQWQPVVDKVKDELPAERSESNTGQREEGRDVFSISSKYEEGYSDVGLDSTPQSQSEDTSDTDSTIGKLMKVKSRWRRASEAEAPPPPPPPSKTQAQQADVQEKTDEKQDDDEEIKIDFELIDENIHLNESRKRSKQMREVRRMVCDCTTSREDREMGYEACGEDCLNKMLFIECGSKCPCGEYCNNKRFQKKQNAKVTPFRTEWKGCGLKALEDLEVGQFVMEYVGEVLDYPLFKKRSKQYSKAGQQHFYFMAINPEEIVDATIKGNISRFINHSCDPNCETQKWTVNGSLRVGFFVRKPIKKDEEITFDYKYEVYGKEAQKCYCGTEACRGWLGGDKRMELKSSRRSTSVDEAEKKKKELFDDSDKLEEEIERMCELEQGLRNKTDVLNMCRLMVRVEDPKHRLQILKVLENTTEPACLRLFLDYHGLPLVWCWMADVKQSESADLKHSTLNVLKQLPITNKTVLQNSKILDIVTKWSDAGDTLLEPVSDVLETSQEVTDTDNTENDDEVILTPPVSNKNPVSILASPLDKKAVKKSVKFAEVESSSDSESRASASEADTGDTVDMDVTSSSQTGARTRKQKLELRRKVLEKESGDSDREPVDGDTDSVSDGIQSADADSSSEKQSENNQNETDSENNDLKMSDMESDDKSETLDQSEGRTLELSEDTDMSDVTGGDMSDVTAGESDDVGISQRDAEELETIVKNAEIRNLASELLQQWSTLKELYKIPKKQVLEERKRTERELDTHYEKFARIEERKKKVSGWDVKGRKRKRESSYNKDRDEDSDSRRALLSTPPRMSKLERRQLFEAQVKAQDERDAELQRQQEQMLIEEQMMQQQHQRQLMQDPGFWYYATQDPTFLPSIGIDPQQFLQQLAVDPVLLQQLMATIPNFQQQLEHLTYMYQQAVLQASQLDMVMPQPEPPVVMEDNEPMTEQHMAFLQQVEAFKQQHLEPAAPQLDPTGEEDVPPPPSPPRGKAVVLPPNWKTARDAEGKMYYYHTVTRQTQWDPPNLDTGDHNIDDMDLGTPTFDDTNNKPETKEEKTTTAAADTSSEMSRKLKEHFKTKMSSWIVVCLNPFRKPDCKLGKISSTEDFKHLARKLTHHVMAKELKHCRHVEDLEVNENVKYKAKDFVKKYMTKFGHHYKRSGNSPNYD